MTKPKLIFLPDAFDDFEGTQEELDKLVEEIHKKFADGSLVNDSEPIDLNDLDEIILEKLERAFVDLDVDDEVSGNRTLH